MEPEGTITVPPDWEKLPFKSIVPKEAFKMPPEIVRLGVVKV
jgi:hypothetical protein